MRAWQFHGPHKALTTAEKPEPSPGPGQVKIAVKAAGLCHSDVGILEDKKWLELIPQLPRTPGHEIAGVVEQLGEGVTGVAVGARVCVYAVLDLPGYAVDGGFGEKVIVSAASLVPIPEGVSFAYAAVATDAGATAHSAIMRRGAMKPGEKVAIIGFGGLGSIGAKLVTLNGGELFVVDVKESIRADAEKAGARRIVKDVRELKDEQLTLIVDFAGFGVTTAAAVETIMPEGRVVLVGLGVLEATLNTYPLTIGNVDLRGNGGSAASDLETVLDWMRKGEIEPTLEYILWNDIGQGISRLQTGNVNGRLVCLYE